MDIIEDDNDKFFFQNSRKPGRPGCMVGLDEVIFQKDVKQACNKHPLERKRRRLLLEKSFLFERTVLEGGTGSANCDKSKEEPCTSTSTLIFP